MNETTEQKIILERLTNLIDNNKREHGAILDQVKRTNGTVCRNSEKINALEKWRSMIIGGLVIVNIVLVPLIVALVLERL